MGIKKLLHEIAEDIRELYPEHADKLHEISRTLPVDAQVSLPIHAYDVLPPGTDLSTLGQPAPVEVSKPSEAGPKLTGSDVEASATPAAPPPAPPPPPAPAPAVSQPTPPPPVPPAPPASAPVQPPAPAVQQVAPPSPAPTLVAPAQVAP